MAHEEGGSSSVANPNRVKTETWQEIYAQLGVASVRLPKAKALTEADIEELTTRVD